MFSGIALHPEVLRKAHAELDAVVGPHRLPDFSDKDSLPYVNAVIKESMRWHSALPLGVPHATVADDEFRGYFIPAGTMLIPNTWYVAPCCHWSINGLLNIQLGRACTTPRFTLTRMTSGLNASYATASSILVFGTRQRLSSDTVEGTSRGEIRLLVYGNEAHALYRICPGRYFAEATLFINIACVLHVFYITPPLGEDVRPMHIEYIQSDTLISWVSFR